MRLANRVAIVTGAASGIGRASAIVFAKEGAKIVAADINDGGGKETVNSIKANGGEAIFIHTDVAVASEAENLVKAAIKKFGKIDILLNVAGILPKHMPIEDVDDELWDRVHGVNLKGPFHTMKYTIPFMKKARSGAIINVSAGAGITPPRPDCSAYVSSKGALLTLTKEVSLEARPYNIRVNSITPSGTDTPMALQSQIEFGLDESAKQNMTRTMPFGRMIKPEEIGYAALFLASDEALMLSGTNIDVNAGRLN